MIVYIAVFLLPALCFIEALAEPVRSAQQQAVAAIAGDPLTGFDALIAKAETQSEVPVLIRLNVKFQPEGLVPAAEVTAQRKAIATAQNAIIQSLAAHKPRNVKTYQRVPYLALTLNATALRALAHNPLLTSITEDIPIPPTLAESTGVVGADSAWAVDLDGSGWTVAILDTGVDTNHSFLAGKVVSEACYSTTNSVATSLCPDGASSSTAPGSGINCPLTTRGCNHGTHVAGIVAGRNYIPGGPGYDGVARGANIIAIQVFSQFSGADCTNFGLTTPCALSYTSDQILALERVLDLSSSFNIASANMSLAGGRYFSNCDTNSRKAIVDTLRAVGIATVIASGNSGYRTAMAAPACISTAISVGATCDHAGVGQGCTAVDAVAGYSNIASFISLLAPGSLISSSVPGTNTFASWHGTSMAAPHVAGAWAVMRQQEPTGTVASILSKLQNTGVMVDDQRSSGVVTGMKRIDLTAALTDSDGDGLPDMVEAQLGTSPNNVDSDGDGLVDGADGVVSTTTYPGGIDINGDGFVDGELDLGTNPAISNRGDLAPRGASDNLINAADLLVLTRLVTGVILPTGLEAFLGDLNGDMQLDVIDVLRLEKAVLDGTPP
jgi:subtilisin family serine protease